MNRNRFQTLIQTRNNGEIMTSDNRLKYHTILDYLKFYNKSLLDGYRRTENNNKDLIKLENLNMFL